MARTVTWLHISDLHLRNGDGYHRDKVIDALIESLPGLLAANKLRPEVVFFTGDLAYGGHQAEYEPATGMFRQLLKALGLDESRLHLIPGNHDVDKKAGRNLLRTLGSSDEVDEYFGPDEPRDHQRKFAAFEAWHRSFFAQGQVWESGTTAQPIRLVRLPNCTLAVACLNTAWFSMPDRQDHNRLWLSRRCLEAALQAGADDLADADLRVALMHHPVGWLNDAERTAVRATLMDNFDFVLRGHLHENEALSVSDGQASVRMLSAGATYQDTPYPRSCCAVQVDLEARSFLLLPLHYVDSPRSQWTTDPSLGGAAGNSWVVFSDQQFLAAPPTPQVKSGSAQGSADLDPVIGAFIARIAQLGTVSPEMPALVGWARGPGAPASRLAVEAFLARALSRGVVPDAGPELSALAERDLRYAVVQPLIEPTDEQSPSLAPIDATEDLARHFVVLPQVQETGERWVAVPSDRLLLGPALCGKTSVLSYFAALTAREAQMRPIRVVVPPNLDGDEAGPAVRRLLERVRSQGLFGFAGAGRVVFVLDDVHQAGAFAGQVAALQVARELMTAPDRHWLVWATARPAEYIEASRNVSGLWPPTEIDSSTCALLEAEPGKWFAAAILHPELERRGCGDQADAVIQAVGEKAPYPMRFLAEAWSRVREPQPIESTYADVIRGLPTQVEAIIESLWPRTRLGIDAVALTSLHGVIPRLLLLRGLGKTYGCEEAEVEAVLVEMTTTGALVSGSETNAFLRVIDAVRERALAGGWIPAYLRTQFWSIVETCLDSFDGGDLDDCRLWGAWWAKVAVGSANDDTAPRKTVAKCCRSAAELLRETDLAGVRGMLLLTAAKCYYDTNDTASDDYREACSQAAAFYEAEASRYPESAEAWSGLAAARWNGGQDLAALQALTRACELEPDDAHLWSQRGMMEYRTDVPGAKESLDLALTLDNQDTEALFYRALIAEEESELERASEQFARLTTLAPGDPFGWYHRGIVEGRRGRPLEALAYFDECLKIDGAFAPAWLDKAVALSQLERFEEVLEALAVAEDLGVDSPQLHSLRGTSLARLGQLDEALASVDRALAGEPRQVGNWLNKVLLLGDLDRFTEALEAVEEGLSQVGREPVLLQHRLLLLGQLDRLDDALAQCDELLELGPDGGWALAQKMGLLAELDRGQEALEIADRLIEAAPTDLAPRLDKAQLQAELGDHQGALQTCDEAVRRGLNGPELQDVRCVALASQDRWEEALAAARAAQNLDQDYVPAMLNEAEVLSRVGRLEEALEVLDQAVAVEPAFPESWRLRGQVKMRLGRPTDAAADFAECLRLDPHHPVATLEQATAMRDAGQYDEAAQAYTAALAWAEDPDIPELVAGRARTYFCAGDMVKAAADYEHVLTDGAEDGELWSEYAIALFQLDRYDATCEAAERAIEFGADEPPLRLIQAGSMVAEERYEDAVAALDQCLASGPSDDMHLMAQEQRARLLLLQERYDEGFAAIDEVLDAGGDRAQWTSLRAGLLHELGRETEFPDACWTAARASGNDLELWEVSAEALARQERYGEVLEILDEALERGVEIPGARYLRGTALAQVGRPADGLPLIEQFLVDNPDHAEGWSNSAALAFHAGDLDAALGALDRAIELEPTEERLGGRAEILAHLGKWDPAVDAIGVALGKGVHLEEKAVATCETLLRLVFGRCPADEWRHLVGRLVASYTEHQALPILQKALQRSFHHPPEDAVWASGLPYALSAEHTTSVARWALEWQQAAGRSSPLAATIDLLDVSVGGSQRPSAEPYGSAQSGEDG